MNVKIRIKCLAILEKGASQVALVVKNPPASAGDIRDTGLIPGLINAQECKCWVIW